MLKRSPVRTNRQAKQVSIDAVTNFPKKMRRLKMNSNLEQQKLHTRRKNNLKSAKINNARPSIVCEDI